MAPDGLVVEGGAGLAFAVAPSLTLGPLAVDRVNIALELGDDGALAFAARASAAIGLGPVTATVDGVGAAADLAFVEVGEGNVGPFDVGVRFVPPDRLGLAIDAAAVRGGGLLSMRRRGVTAGR